MCDVCGPEVSFETCVAMKFVDDDDDDDDVTKIYHFYGSPEHNSWSVVLRRQTYKQTNGRLQKETVGLSSSLSIKDLMDWVRFNVPLDTF